MSFLIIFLALVSNNCNFEELQTVIIKFPHIWLHPHKRPDSKELILCVSVVPVESSVCVMLSGWCPGRITLTREWEAHSEESSLPFNNLINRR